MLNGFGSRSIFNTQHREDARPQDNDTYSNHEPRLIHNRYKRDFVDINDQCHSDDSVHLIWLYRIFVHVCGDTSN
jgi:hypothetical protein